MQHSQTLRSLPPPFAFRSEYCCFRGAFGPDTFLGPRRVDLQAAFRWYTRFAQVI
jgi:hypothetical protein